MRNMKLKKVLLAFRCDCCSASITGLLAKWFGAVVAEILLTLKTTQSSVLPGIALCSVISVISSIVKGDELLMRNCRFGRTALGLVFVLSLLLVAPLSLAAAPNIRVGVYDTKPLLYVENGDAKGLFVDVLDHIVNGVFLS